MMRNAIAAALTAVLWGGAATPCRAITIGFDPAAQNVTAGSSVDVALVVSGLGDGIAPSLSTFDVDIAFDDSVLSFLGATFGDPMLGDQLDLTGLGSTTGVTPGSGFVNLFELSFDSPSDLGAMQAGSFTLAALTFSAVGPGVSTLGVSVNALGDANGDPLEADVAGGSVTVERTSSVPEPASMLLVVSGFLGLARLRASQRG
jgi:hypothetical protein